MEDSPFPSWTPLILLGSAVVALLLTVVVNVDPRPVAKPVLRTLAIVQGALFAIVFSIIILGVRSSANRYSPRVAELYRLDSAYLWTFVVFGGSIGVSILGLYLLPSPALLLRYFVVFGGVLAMVAFWTLYQFVGYILQQTTPEGILQRIDDHLVPEYIVKQSERAAVGLAEPNPYLILISTINSAIEDGDDTTAEIGLQIVGRRTRDVLEHGTGDRLEVDGPLADAIEELCRNRLVGVAHNALANSLPEVAEATLDSFQTTVEVAADAGMDHIALYALEGLFEITGTIDFDIRADRVRRESINTGVDTIHTVAEGERWAALGDGVRVMGWRVAESIQERGGEARHDAGYRSLFIRWVPALFEEVVNQLDIEVRDGDIDWSRGILFGEDEISDEEAVLHSFFLSTAEMTSAVIRYQVRTGRPLVGWQYVAQGWSSGFAAIPEGFMSLRSTWLSTMLYIDYLCQHLGENRSRVFQNEIRRSVPSELIDEMIDRILASELEPRGPIDIIPGMMDPTEVPALTGFNAPPEIEADREFEDWLELQRGMRSRLKSGGWGAPDDDFFDEDEEDALE